MAHRGSQERTQADQFAAVEAPQGTGSVCQFFPERLSHPTTIVGELDAFDPPVLWVRLATNSPHGLEAIHDSGQVRSVVLQLARQCLHRCRTAGGQLQQHLGLHCGEPALSGEFLELRLQSGLHPEREADHLTFKAQVAWSVCVGLAEFSHFSEAHAKVEWVEIASLELCVRTYLKAAALMCGQHRSSLAS